jgi:plasmid replication initiation protein
MARCWFSLTPGRAEPIQHEYVDARTGQTETIRISGSPDFGIATVHDQDLLIYVISQWIDAKQAGLEPSRRIHFTPYQFLSWMNREPGGGQYQRLKEALNRLRMTTIQTTVRSDKNRRNRVRQFSWISEWEITEENGEIRGVEVVLAEWLFESIHDFHVLTLDKRYFDIPGSLERWLYLYARKATGGAHGIWRESFKSLYQKSASQGAFKHFANSLRKLTKKNELPGLRLSQQISAKGKPLLVMERTEKREIKETKSSPQLELIERTPLEEAWENVFEILSSQLSAPTANAWFGKLRLVGLENGVLTYRADSKFIADYIESHFSGQLRSAWQSLGHEATAIRFEIKKTKSAA